MNLKRNSRKSAPSVFDLVVIGSGPAGQKAAMQGAKVGKKVAVIEKFKDIGGGCVHDGTLPSKSFRESVYRFSLGSRGTLGQEAEHHAATSRKKVWPEMPRLLKRRDRVVSGETAVVTDQLKRNKIQVFKGEARFVSPNDVEVVSAKGTEQITSEVFVVAVGATPESPSHLVIDGKHVFDSNNILDLKHVPKRMVVLGAGIIGCEYASMFSMAGTRVHLVDRRHEILASVDREIVVPLIERFDQQGVEIILRTECEKIEKRTTRGSRSVKDLRVHLANGRKVNADVVLVALGRRGNTDHLNLASAGVRCGDRGLIEVNEYYQTNVPHIYAVGDVIGPPALASTSMEQGRIACCHAFHIASKGDFCEYRIPELFPFGIYTIPEIAMIGKTEEQLRASGVDFVAGKAKYRELARGQIVGDRWGLLKILVDRKTQKLLGVHIVGDSAADLIHIGQAVMTLGGDVHYFIDSVFNYPTFAEAYKTAAFHAVNQIRGLPTRDV